MADAQILRAARALIADPLHWTTASMARDERGVPTYPRSRHAVCWCALGALAQQHYSLTTANAENEALCVAALELFGTRAIGSINDRHGHAAVLAVYDAAIAKADAL